MTTAALLMRVVADVWVVVSWNQAPLSVCVCLHDL